MKYNSRSALFYLVVKSIAPRFLNFNIFTIECFSRYPICPIVKIDGTMDGAKYKTILEDYMLPFVEVKMVPDWKISH